MSCCKQFILMSYVEKKFTLVDEESLTELIQIKIDNALETLDNQWWTYKQAAEYLGISVSKLKKLRASDEIIPYKPSPGIVRFNKQICDRYMMGGGSE